MISCGWCGHATSTPTCIHCGRDPSLPWVQRGQVPPSLDISVGRPELDAADITRRYERARVEIERSGRHATVEAIAEALDRSPRTVREWRKRYGLR